MPVLVLAVQNSVPAADIGSASALTHFAWTIGGTLGVAAMAVSVSAGCAACCALALALVAIGLPEDRLRRTVEEPEPA